MKLTVRRIPAARADGIVERVMEMERLDGLGGLGGFIRLLGA